MKIKPKKIIGKVAKVVAKEVSKDAKAVVHVVSKTAESLVEVAVHDITQELLSLLSKIMNHISPAFVQHTAVVRNTNTKEADRFVAIGVSQALEQVYSVLSQAKFQIEKGEPVVFEAPETKEVAV